PAGPRSSMRNTAQPGSMRIAAPTTSSAGAMRGSGWSRISCAAAGRASASAPASIKARSISAPRVELRPLLLRDLAVAAQRIAGVEQARPARGVGGLLARLDRHDGLDRGRRHRPQELEEMRAALGGTDPRGDGAAEAGADLEALEPREVRRGL